MGPAGMGRGGGVPGPWSLSSLSLLSPTNLGNFWMKSERESAKREICLSRRLPGAGMPPKRHMEDMEGPQKRPHPSPLILRQSHPVPEPSGECRTLIDTPVSFPGREFIPLPGPLSWSPFSRSVPLSRITTLGIRLAFEL